MRQNIRCQYCNDMYTRKIKRKKEKDSHLLDGYSFVLCSMVTTLCCGLLRDTENVSPKIGS